MMKKKKLTDERWDEAVDELTKKAEDEGEIDFEPSDDDVWELLAEWNDGAYDDYADQQHEQRRDER